jgi:hypothetical protein
MTIRRCALALALVVFAGCSGTVGSAPQTGGGVGSGPGRSPGDQIHLAFKNATSTCVYLSPEYSWSNSFTWYEAGAHVVKSGEVVYLNIDMLTPFGSPNLEQRDTVEYFSSNACISGGTSPHAPVKTGKITIDRIDDCYEYRMELIADADYNLRFGVKPGCN